MLIGTKSAIVWKKNLKANLSTVKKNFKIQNKILHWWDYTFSWKKKNPKVSSNYACLAVILIGFFLKGNENYYP